MSTPNNKNKSNKKKENNKQNTSTGYNCNDSSDQNNCRFFNDDIPNGFQDINPNSFLLSAESFAGMLVNNIPLNVQNAIGGWFQLVGQILETYNAQQQYFQQGPGRYYNPKYRNVNNDKCSYHNGTTGGTQTTSTSTSDIGNLESKIKSLERQIEILTEEIKKLKESNKIYK